MVSAPLLQKTVIVYSLINIFTTRGVDIMPYLIIIHFSIKVISVFFCIAPFFGLQMFDLPSAVMGYAFLWHSFLAFIFFVWLLDHHCYFV